MPKPQPKLKPRPKQSRPEIVVTPKPGSNIVEQAPFIGFMLDELIQEQRVAMMPLIEKLEQVRLEVAQVKAEIAIRRDEGEYRYYEDTATTTETIYDFIRDFGFAIKSYTLINDGANDIEVGHMSEEHLLDVSPERFGTVLNGETFPMLNNNPVVRKIIIKTESGTADYRLWVLW